MESAATCWSASTEAEIHSVPHLFPNQDTKISKLLARKEEHSSTLQDLHSKEFHTSMAACPGDASHQTYIFALPLPPLFLVRVLYSRCLNVLNKLWRTLEVFISAHRHFTVYLYSWADNLEMVIKFSWERFSVMDISIKDDRGCFPAVPYSAVCYTRVCTTLNLLQSSMRNRPYRTRLQHTSVSAFPWRLWKTECQHVLVILQALTSCFLQMSGSRSLALAPQGSIPGVPGRDLPPARVGSRQGAGWQQAPRAGRRQGHPCKQNQEVAHLSWGCIHQHLEIWRSSDSQHSIL